MEKENKTKMKNISLIIIMFILITLGITTISNARDWGRTIPKVNSVSRGDKFSLSFTEYNASANIDKLFCIQNEEHLGGGEYHNYTVKRIIEIDGDTASNEKGKTISNGWNARLAYVIHNTSGQARRRAIWYYFPKWVEHVGSELEVESEWTKEENEGLAGVPSESEIDKYVNKVKDMDGASSTAYVKKKSTDEEPTAKLPISSNYREKFIKVGPFKLAFSPKLASMTIEGVRPNGDNITINSNNDDIRFVSDGNVHEEIDKLKSNEEFSILIPIEKRITRITNIKVETKFTNNTDKVISAEIAILTTISGIQNLAIIETAEGSTTPTRDILNMDLDISTTVDVVITKVNSQNTNEKLPDVGFKLYHKQLGKWVKQENGRTKYIDNEQDATEFKTGTMHGFNRGQAKIFDLLLGDYKFVETKQPNYKFEMATKDFTLSSNSTNILQGQLVPIEIPNDPIGGMLIEKVDESNENIKIPGVKFKLRNKSLSGSYQWVIQDSSGNISYIDEGRAKIFETNGSGQASIPKLAVGEYEFKEIEVPEGYECDSKYFTVTEGDINSESTIKYTIKNKPIGDGGILIEKVDEENENIKISGVTFKLKNTSIPGDNQWVSVDSSGEVSYVAETDAKEFTTDQYGRAKISKLQAGDYEFHEVEVPEDYECENKYFTVTEDQSERMEMETIPYTITNKKKEKEPVTIIINKVDSDNQNIKLSGVGFKLRSIQDNKWIYQDSFGETTYVDSEASATIFYTENGQKRIENIYEGDYEFKEVIQPNYGYECISQNFIVRSSSEATIQYFTIKNKQEKIKLSGRVWIDKHSGKQNIRNDLYMTNYHYNQPEYVDDSDEPVPGLTVKLMKNGAVERTTVTGSDGTYKFDDISVDELNNYYIEFEYNGLIYTNVDQHLDHNNGSKAIEGYARDGFNEGFDYIENGGSQTKGVTKNADKEIKHNLSYEIKDHIATLGREYKDINNAEFRIAANTKESKYNLYNEYIKQKNNSTTPIDCVEHNNLGIYEREQPDIALVKDIQNVKLAINGYEHIYEYAQRFVNQNEYGDGYEVGVKFGNKYGNKYGNMRYTRPIYKSDYMWENTANRSKELEVYITYKIQIKNQSTNLVTRVNNVVDYYDINYKLTGVGRTLTGNGTVGSPIEKFDGGNVNDNYTKIIINTEDILMTPQTTQDIYVQFRLSKEKVKDIIDVNDKNESILLNNVAEINSYTTFDKYGDIYAGIDKNSAPGNAVPGNTDTYEDDTDTAPGLLLKTSDNARQISGTVFLDHTDDRLLTAQIREGNGQFKEDDGDKGIKGVQVKLVEESGTGKTYYVGSHDGTGNTTNDSDSKTDNNGNFTISGFIPGKYRIIYTWGGEFTKDANINVQDYKGTVYDEERYNLIKTTNEKDENYIEGGGINTTVYKWYKDETPRYTDAIDDYNTRIEIDKELKTKTYSSDSTIPVHFERTMDSTTQLMKIAIEYDDEAFKSHDDNITYKYEINNIDFGIVRRAKQSVELDKRVTSMKMTLANGQVVSEVTIEEDEHGNRKLKDEGENNHVTYMGPLNTPSNKSPGFVKVELDNELLQGAKIEAKYEFKFKNKSEIDLINETYYKFGSKSMSQRETAESSYKLNGAATERWAKPEEVVKVKPNHIIDYLDRNWGYEENQNWTAITKHEFIEKYVNEGLVSPDILSNEDSTINDRIILYNTEWEDSDLVYPGEETTSISLTVSKTLTTTDDISLGNETEIIELTKGSIIPNKRVDPDNITPGGATIVQKPGNYIPGTSPLEPDEDESETVIVTPSTGANLAFVIPITIAVIALVILGTGIVLIKKKVIDIKK